MKNFLMLTFALLLFACTQGDNPDPSDIGPGTDLCNQCSGPNTYNFYWPDQNAHMESIPGASCTRFEISGNGAINLYGDSERLCYKQSGNGAVSAYSFKVKSAYLSISGNGAMTFYVTDSLTVVHSGSGNIRYTGHPAYTNITINGSGTVAPF